ncbi:uncharacterized protein LOC141910110 [Tubulanus polymorphus]|uniref:uncharacterized protein LOC141910110 n=1 Tax=Tubulanus polymorphus TaxID=672921 RepID=UPI003DA5F9CD
MFPAMEISRRNNCYCCASPPAGGVDLDNALHELGMLSTVTESRRQYLRERADRARAKSESDKEIRMNSTTATGLSAALPHSPGVSYDVDAGVQIVQMDPKYVIGVSTDVRFPSSPVPPPGSNRELGRLSFIADCGFTPVVPDPKAQEYSRSDVVVEMDDSSKPMQVMSPPHLRVTVTPRRRCQRAARSSRAKRSSWTKKKPYELPRGRLSRSVEEQTTLNGGAAASSVAQVVSPAVSKPGGLTALFHRSKSMDDLDVAKLQLTDRQERQEIETMSDHLRDLNVNDQTAMSAAI